ncbi:hypothetical protein [Draconibacterium mangrovi]|uniref:hypothetical protein n=1 Tax=Draconibacterium mangrovi TaxID=2697469 RepID=UPI0013D1D1B4|nr:hypothetical protein [Draconibacterium mangrovi]
MKKLGKLSINPEKVIENNELLNLKGGYAEDPGKVYCFDSQANLLGTFLNPYCSGDLLEQCRSYYSGTTFYNCMV